MASGKNMFEIMWERMDELVVKYYETLEVPDVDEALLIGEMRGLGFAIRNFSHPFLQGDRAVSRHAWERRQAIVTEQRLPDTPGVAGYNPIPPAGVKLRGTSAFKEPALKTNLSEMTATQIVAGLDAGFPHSDLAAIYKVPLGVIEAIARGAR